jgi:NAD(P)-dependent dehydrogenase (short-subunit alcohol dehydrogenase family)
MVKQLDGKVAIVTGATYGIGKAIADLFAQEGAKITLAARDENKGKAALEEVKMKSDAIFVKTDVSKSSEVKRMVDETILKFDRIDVLVNNAGVAPLGTILDSTEETWDYTIGVNLKGVFLCCKCVIPHMLRNRSGSIVNIGSINSFMAMENEAVYDASKGGVLMLTRAIALDFAKSNIRANCICPGAIETPLLMTQLKMAPDPEKVTRELVAKHPVGRMGKPEEIAKAALFLATDSSSFITGTTIAVDGGILAGWPS